MTETCDWSRFYSALCNLGPHLLLGIDDYTLEMIEAVASSTDMFWSDGLQELLAEKSTNDDLRANVLSVLELWKENVLQTIDTRHNRNDPPNHRPQIRPLHISMQFFHVHLNPIVSCKRSGIWL